MKNKNSYDKEFSRKKKTGKKTEEKETKKDNDLKFWHKARGRDKSIASTSPVRNWYCFLSTVKG